MRVLSLFKLQKCTDASHQMLSVQEMNRTFAAGTPQWMPGITPALLQLYNRDKEGSTGELSVPGPLQHSAASLSLALHLFFSPLPSPASSPLFLSSHSSGVLSSSSPLLHPLPLSTSLPLLPTCLSVRNWSNVLIEARRRDGNF